MGRLRLQMRMAKRSTASLVHRLLAFEWLDWIVAPRIVITNIRPLVQPDASQGQTIKRAV
ncbi:hypothetical protein JM93_03275 [Roseibium hamelinense]|uniref:Uncharacterized protein n=1 Tax=Roseibium hamelinense TaxID=150831 RepID=A0A562SN74_9HYPH|nr:hypothetical protein JM93_03275 [Roseibium hamelinense]